MNLVNIGYISKAHGLKGHCVLKIKDEYFIDEENINAVFIDINGSSAPYFVEELSWNNTAYLLKLEGIDSVETAKKLIGKACSVNEDLVEENDDNQLVGYTVIDHVHGNLGPVEEVIDNKNSVLLRVTFKGKEVLLPLVDDLITEIDDEGQTISYQAPEGLIEMYLS